LILQLCSMTNMRAFSLSKTSLCRGEYHRAFVDTHENCREMSPIARQPLIEESVLKGIAKGWKYLSYAIRQLVILFPNLWAGYERVRRKGEKMKTAGKQVATESKNMRGVAVERNELIRRRWTSLGE